MASKVITQETINSIQADWKTGAFVQRDLAYKYKVSVGVINKHTKGLNKSTEHIVNNLIQAKQELNKLDEQTVHAVNEVFFNVTGIDLLKGQEYNTYYCFIGQVQQFQHSTEQSCIQKMTLL